MRKSFLIFLRCLGLFLATRRRIRAENARLRVNLVEALLQIEGLKDRLVREGGTDALTELPNRRQLDETLARAIAHAVRSSEPLSIAVIDIDHFKSVNDDHGHLVGDDLLRVMGKILKQSCRESDFCARFGGEEFVVVLVDAGLAGATTLIERLRTVVEKKLFVSLQGSVKVDRTASFGLAELRPGETPKSLIERADEALYAAKRGGRNRVVVATNL